VRRSVSNALIHRGKRYNRGIAGRVSYHRVKTTICLRWVRRVGSRTGQPGSVDGICSIGPKVSKSKIGRHKGGSLRSPQLVYSTFITRAIGGMWSVAAHFVDPNMSPHEAPLAFAFLASSSLSRFRARYRSFALNISEPVFWLLAFSSMAFCSSASSCACF
jgi:hypothetical protein